METEFDCAGGVALLESDYHTFFKLFRLARAQPRAPEEHKVAGRVPRDLLEGLCSELVHLQDGADEAELLSIM